MSNLTDVDINRLALASAGHPTVLAAVGVYMNLGTFARAIEAHVRGEQQASCSETCRNYEAHANHCPEVDPFAELKAAHAAGKQIQFRTRHSSQREWVNANTPQWIGAHEYRIKDADPYAELKAAHAAGKTIQTYVPAQQFDWHDIEYPQWLDSQFYRIKP